MNRQPYQTPPRYWPPQMNPWWVRVFRPLSMRLLRRKQKILRIDVQEAEHLQRLREQGAGILLTPNHSFHYDSYVLMEAALRCGGPVHVMTAWQVFAMSNRFERWSMQKHGCFSIDRESNDLQAFRQAVRLLEESPYPLVIFPEGDIYHTNDRANPFREGAAAIALAAARKAKRPIACVPCALKCWYVQDPTPQLLRLMDRLEQRLLWRPRHAMPLVERVYHLAEGILSLKEQEYLGHTRSGGVRERCDYLANVILTRQEEYYKLRVNSDGVPERVKELRRVLIDVLKKPDLDANERTYAHSNMEDLFLVIQLYSYPGNYMREQPTIERIAETLDKLEEDILRTDYPAVRGTRRAVVRFGEPIVLAAERRKKDAVPALTNTLQKRVQGLLDEMNKACGR